MTRIGNGDISRYDVRPVESIVAGVIHVTLHDEQLGIELLEEEPGVEGAR